MTAWQRPRKSILISKSRPRMIGGPLTPMKSTSAACAPAKNHLTFPTSTRATQSSRRLPRQIRQRAELLGGDSRPAGASVCLHLRGFSDQRIGHLQTCRGCDAASFSEARFRRLFSAAKQTGSSRIEVVVDSSADRLRVLGNKGELPRAIRKWVNADGRMADDSPETALEELRQLGATDYPWLRVSCARVRHGWKTAVARLERRQAPSAEPRVAGSRAVNGTSAGNQGPALSLSARRDASSRLHRAGPARR